MMNEWPTGKIDDVLIEIDDRNTDGDVELVLSVTEGRGIVPQSEIFKKRIATSDTAKYKLVEPLDIAWNPYLLWTGAVGQWLGSARGVTSPVYPVFRTRKDQDSRFWGLVLESGHLTPYFDSTAVGSIQRRRRTTVPVFKAAPVSVPSRAEQHRIVCIMTAVDAQIDALANEIAMARRSLSALREDVPEADEVPLASVLDGIDSGKSAQTTDEKPLPGEPSLLKLSAIQLGAFAASEAKRLDNLAGYYPVHMVTEGDLLITRASGSLDRIGYAAIARDVPPRTYMPDLIWRIRTKADACQTAFLAHLLSSPSVRSKITASARGTASMRKINKALLRSLYLPIPALGEQSAYVKRCDAVAFAVARLNEEHGRLRVFRSTLLRSLLNQEIEIPESYDRLLEGVSSGGVH